MLPVVGTLILVLAGAVWYFFNRLVKARNMLDEAWSDIDVQLRRRHDLLGPLVSAVKGYSEYEKAIMERIAQLRTTSPAEGKDKSTDDIESEYSKNLRSILALTENYPDLKANESFQQFQAQLVQTEDLIQAARRYYNGSVRDYNILVEAFPTNMIARRMDYTRERFFEIEYATERKTPDVRFR